MSRRAVVCLDPGKLRDNAGTVVMWVDDHKELADVRDPFARPTVRARPNESFVAAKRRADAIRRGDLAAMQDAERDAQARAAAPRVTGDVIDARLLPLGTSYVDVCRHVRDEMGNSALQSPDGPPFLVFDQTGVGEALDDILNEMGVVERRGIWFTVGQRPKFDRGTWHVAKTELVTHAHVAMERKPPDLRGVKGMPYAEQLMAELRNFRVVESPSGRDVYGAAEDSRDRERRVNDDMIAALIAGWWYGSKELKLHVWTEADYAASHVRR